MRQLRAIAVVAAMGIAGGCTTTTILATWKKPGIGRVTFHRMVVFAPARDQATRRNIEDRLARELGIPAAPAYALVPDDATDEQLHLRMMQGDFDGALVMRLVSVEREAVWVPGSWDGPYFGYLGWQMYEPGRMEIE